MIFSFHKNGLPATNAEAIGMDDNRQA